MKSIILMSIVCLILITQCEMTWANTNNEEHSQLDSSAVNSDLFEDDEPNSNEDLMNKRLIEFKRFIEFKRGAPAAAWAAKMRYNHKRPSIGARTRTLSKSN